MPARTIEAVTSDVEAAERRAAQARQEAALMAAAARALVKACADQVDKLRLSSAADIERAQAALAEARALLERAEELAR